MRSVICRFVAAGLLLSGCGADTNATSPTHEPFRSLVSTFGAEYATNSVAIVYIDPRTGDALKGCAESLCRALGGIRVTVQRGQPANRLSHLRLRNSNGSFGYYAATDGATSPFGSIRYEPSGLPVAWIEMQYGDGPPIDTANAELTVPHYVVKYAYKASSEQEHVFAYRAVLSFCRAANLIAARPNNSSKPTPLRGAA